MGQALNRTKRFPGCAHKDHFASSGSRLPDISRHGSDTGEAAAAAAATTAMQSESAGMLPSFDNAQRRAIISAQDLERIQWLVAFVLLHFPGEPFRPARLQVKVTDSTLSILATLECTFSLASRPICDTFHNRVNHMHKHSHTDPFARQKSD